MSVDIQQDEASFENRTHRALWHLATCVVYLLLLAGAAYAYPALSRFKAWLPGEGAPIARMFNHKGGLPGFAEAAVHGGRDSLEELRRNLGDVIVANLGVDESDDEGAPGEDDVWIPAEDAPIGQVTQAQTKARSGVSGLAAKSGKQALARQTSDEGQGTDGTRGEGAAALPPDIVSPGAAVSPTEFDGVGMEIENPQALRRFFAQLKRTAERRPGAITRIAHYGDSSVAADAISRTARRRLQLRFGDAGHGFILVSRGNMFYTHAGVELRGTDGWNLYTLVRSQLRSGLYGYGGIQVRGGRSEHASVGTTERGRIGRRVSKFELFFQRFPGGGKVKLQVDQERSEQRIVDTAATEISDGYETINVPDGPHTLHIWPQGREVRLYGVALERDVPGVVYDSLGLVGARAQRLLNAEQTHMQQQIAHRSPHLLVLGFGGNEAGSKWLTMPRYEAELRRVVDLMRGGQPTMDCLIFGPLDQAERDRHGSIQTIPKLMEIVEVQRRVAQEKHCAFFDTFAAMGGEGTFGRWYRSRPQLASSDFRHATPQGYRVIGNLYYKALIKAYAEYLGAVSTAP